MKYKRNLADIRGYACSVTALAHSISTSPSEVYDGFHRDMSIRHRGDIYAYIPPEISTYLFKTRRRHLVVDFDDQEGMPAHMIGTPKAAEVKDWMRDHQKCMVGFQFGELGHWVGFDGWMVNNLKTLGFDNDQAGWDDFVSNLHIDNDLHGKLKSGVELIPRMAILIS